VLPVWVFPFCLPLATLKFVSLFFFQSQPCLTLRPTTGSLTLTLPVQLGFYLAGRVRTPLLFPKRPTACLLFLVSCPGKQSSGIVSPASSPLPCTVCLLGTFVLVAVRWTFAGLYDPFFGVVFFFFFPIRMEPLVPSSFPAQIHAHLHIFCFFVCRNMALASLGFRRPPPRAYVPQGYSVWLRVFVFDCEFSSFLFFLHNRAVSRNGIIRFPAGLVPCL